MRFTFLSHSYRRVSRSRSQQAYPFRLSNEELTYGRFDGQRGDDLLDWQCEYGENRWANSNCHYLVEVCGPLLA
jgi:hypothetical protein